VTRGQPVAHLVMMIPIEVVLTVSAETASRVRVGDIVTLFPGSDGQPVPGRVYEKATVADPETRTMQISVITQNARLGVRFPEDDPRSGLPVVAVPLGLVQPPGEHYVWAATAHRMLDPLPEDRVLTLKKHYVEVGDRYRNYQGLYLFREVADPRGLKPFTTIVVDVPEDFEDGGRVVVSSGDWLMRPGQLVPTLLSHEVPRPGFYLPMNALKPVDSENAVVFLNRDGKAVETRVRLLGHVGDRVRVEGDGIAEGAEVITGHVHFLQDGEAVSVARRRTVEK